jgi:hypothetical protein
MGMQDEGGTVRFPCNLRRLLLILGNMDNVSAGRGIFAVRLISREISIQAPEMKQDF